MQRRRQSGAANNRSRPAGIPFLAGRLLPPHLPGETLTDGGEMPVCRSATIKITKPLEISVTTRNHPHAADAVNLILIVARGITLIVAL